MRLIIIIAVEQDNWAIIAYKQLSCKMLDQIQDGNLKLEVIIIYKMLREKIHVLSVRFIVWNPIKIWTDEF